MNNFNNILTKTESLTTLQGGIENSESGGGVICWTLANYILLRFLQEKIDHFTVIDGSEADGDLVLIQTFFALLWKLFLKNAS